MKILIGILLGILYINTVDGQIQLTPLELNVTYNVQDTIDNTGGVILLESLIPRIKATVKITNNYNMPITLFWTDSGSCYARYRYQNKHYDLKCINANTNIPIGGIQICSHSSYNLILLFSPPQFPRENYMSNFLEIITSLQFVYKGGNGTDKYCYISDKINWNNITIYGTVDIKTEE